MHEEQGNLWLGQPVRLQPVTLPPRRNLPLGSFAAKRAKMACVAPCTIQIVTFCKQSVYKQSGLAEPSELSNRAGLAATEQAIRAKQSRAVSTIREQKRLHTSVEGGGGVNV